MSQLVVAPVLAALITAVLTGLIRRRSTLRAGVSLLGSLAYLGTVAALFGAVSTQGRLTYQLSAWPAPFGISLVADGLSAFMLALAAIVGLAGLVYAVQAVEAFAQRIGFHPLYHLMLVGVSGSFLTGDLFNLFVWFEVMLMASYVLVVLYGGPTQTRAALIYVVLNLAGSALMLVAVGGLYAVTGTLNMADIARRLAEPMAYGINVAPVLGLSSILFAVFALKAGLVPFHFWVPSAYRAAPAPVAAMLAGVVKKVGVYAIIRLYFTVFSAATLPVGFPGIGGRSALAFFGPVLFVLALASIV
ncbi:MAG: proton-conducting transporter membrane subunit, partial [Halobacteriales archaeon]